MSKFHARMKATTLRDLLKAHLVCASKDVTRPHLTGVAVRIEGASLVIASTDGHRMLVSRCGEPTECSFLHDHDMLVIPLEACAGIVASLKGVKAPRRDTDVPTYAELHYTTAKRKWELELNGLRTEYMGADTDTVFPPYKQVIPSASRDIETNHIGIDASYFGDIARVFLPGAKGNIPLRMGLGASLDPLRFDSEVPHLYLEQSYVVMPVRI